MKLWKNLLYDVLEQVFVGTLARLSTNWILLLHLLPQQALHLGVRQIRQVRQVRQVRHGKYKDGKNPYRLIVGNDDAGHAFIFVKVKRVEKKGANCPVHLWMLLANPPLENKQGL